MVMCIGAAAGFMLVPDAWRIRNSVVGSACIGIDFGMGIVIGCFIGCCIGGIVCGIGSMC